jgi:hypothetical protein
MVVPPPLPGTVIHVFPTHSARAHLTDPGDGDNCWCSPRRDDADARIVIHREDN